jgi:hypothetical protein
MERTLPQLAVRSGAEPSAERIGSASLHGEEMSHRAARPAGS